MRLKRLLIEMRGACGCTLLAFSLGVFVITVYRAFSGGEGAVVCVTICATSLIAIFLLLPFWNGFAFSLEGGEKEHIIRIRTVRDKPTVLFANAKSEKEALSLLKLDLVVLAILEEGLENDDENPLRCYLYCFDDDVKDLVLSGIPIQSREYIYDSENGHPIVVCAQSRSKFLADMEVVANLSNLGGI